MSIMQEAVDREDWELMDAGKPPRKKKVVVIPEPEMPKVENLLKFEDVPLERVNKLISAKRRNLRSDKGWTFTGFDVIIELKTEDKRKPGRPPKALEEILAEEPRIKTLSGWMIEGEWNKLFRHIRNKIDFRVVSL